MGMKRVYTCDICRDKIQDPNESFGVHFESNTDFTLGNYGCTEGVHICYRCAAQLKYHLSTIDI